MTLTLNTTIQFLCKTLWLMIMYYKTKFGSKRLSSSEDVVELLYFDHMSLCCDLDLKNRKPIFLHALKFMTMHHNTKFGNKMFGGLEAIVWANIDIWTLYCDLDLERSNPIFFHKKLRLLMSYY